MRVSWAGGELKRRGHIIMVFRVYDTVGVCNYEKVGFGGQVGLGHGFGLRSEEGIYRGGMWHRLINDACWISHQGFFHGNGSNLVP